MINRTGLTCSAAVAAAALTAAAAEPPRTFTSDDTFLAVDETVFATREGVSLLTSEAIKYEHNPVVAQGNPGQSDAGRLSFPWVLLENGLFRMWYVAYDGDEFSLAYAESDDGYRWRRPELGLVQQNGSKANNVVASGLTVMPGIYRDDADPDPARRYKAPVHGTITEADMATDAQRKKYRGKHPSLLGIAYSPDGLRWTTETSNPFPIKAKLECPVLYRVGDKWVLAHQMNTGDYPEVNRWSRFLGVSTSDDLVHWDLSDKPAFFFDPRHNGIMQTHAAPGFQNYGNVLVAAQGLFLNQPELIEQETDLTLIVSNDGLRWRQPKPAQPLSYFLRRGNRGAWDESFPIQSNLLNAGDKTLLYYSAGHYGNASFIGLQIGVASLGLDRYGYLMPQVAWSYGQPEFRARLVSHPIELREANLNLYLNASWLGREGDRLAVELQDPEGNPMPGYTLEACDRLPLDSVGTAVTWAGRRELGDLRGKTVRVIIEMVGANPKRWPMASAEVPRFYAFYFDRPTLWANAPTRVEPGRGLARLDFRDPVRPRWDGVRIDSAQPVVATLTEMTDTATTVRFESAASIELSSDRVRGLTIGGREIASSEGVFRFDAGAGEEAAIRLSPAKR